MRGRRARHFSCDLDLSEFRLEFFDVISERPEQHFCMLGGHDDSCVHPRLGHAWQNPGEIDYEFSRRMRDNGQTRINAFRLLFPKLDVDLLGLLGLVAHVARLPFRILSAVSSALTAFSDWPRRA